ncbi:MAG: hypothetical protein ACPHRO_07990, partial [Nannocystaceae bacterium]
MSAPTAELLSKIDALATSQDVAGLAAYESHADKKVRKAAKKALHVLKSKGVSMPERAAGTSWSVGSLTALRGDLSDRAMLDARSTPGATRLILSQAEPEEGASLMIALVGPDGRLLDFSSGYQTDGQRSRMLRDWERGFEGREIPVEYIKARIGWSRRRTIELGFSVPQGFDAFQERMGALPDEAPDSPVASLLEGAESGEVQEIDALVAAGVPRWPILFEARGLIEKLNAAAGERKDGEAEEMSEAQRREIYLDAVRDDEAVREGIAGPVVSRFEDAILSLWLEGRPAEAQRLREMGDEVRASDAC